MPYVADFNAGAGVTGDCAGALDAKPPRRVVRCLAWLTAGEAATLPETRGLPAAVTFSAESAAFAGAASVIPARLEKTARGPASGVTTGSAMSSAAPESLVENRNVVLGPKKDEP